jgi:hypothetical protein
MNRKRRSLLLLCPSLLAAAAFGVTACAPAHVPVAAANDGVATLEVIDRSNGSTFPVYSKNGQRFIVGNPGSEYRLRLTNRTGARVLVVASVDGVNIISGETATPDQSGYVLGPWESVDIDGWRKSLAQTAAFFFTDLGNSYAARTGRPNDVGVIGLAVFQERQQVAAYPRGNIVGQEAPNDSKAMPAAPPTASAPVNQDAAQANAPTDRVAGAAKTESSGVARESTVIAQKPAPILGTGHGRIENSSVQRVDFVRATPYPIEVVAVRYDRRENLVAMGVIPAPRVIGRAPDPFPGMRFVPDPN